MTKPWLNIVSKLKLNLMAKPKLNLMGNSNGQSYRINLGYT